MSLIDEKTKSYYSNADFNMFRRRRICQWHDIYALILLKNCSTNGGKLII